MFFNLLPPPRLLLALLIDWRDRGRKHTPKSTSQVRKGKYVANYMIQSENAIPTDKLERLFDPSQITRKD